MAAISFALTKKEFLSGCKTCTRRDWPERYRRQWQRWYELGRVNHTAWDKVPFAGGKRIGTFRLTCAPYAERLYDMPLIDLLAEGGMCKSREDFCDLIGKKLSDIVTVIRFVKTSNLSETEEL
jgi:hypothetical protein